MLLSFIQNPSSIEQGHSHPQTKHIKEVASLVRSHPGLLKRLKRCNQRGHSFPGHGDGHIYLIAPCHQCTSLDSVFKVGSSTQVDRRTKVLSSFYQCRFKSWKIRTSSCLLVEGIFHTLVRLSNPSACRIVDCGLSKLHREWYDVASFPIHIAKYLILVLIQVAKINPRASL
jgi:hypothetical protein